MQNTDVHRGNNCVLMMHVHLVFATEYRHACFSSDQLGFFKDIFESVCRDFNAEPVEMNGERDHVHLAGDLSSQCFRFEARQQSQGHFEPNASKAIAGRVRKRLRILSVVAFVFCRQLRRSFALDYQDIHRESGDAGLIKTSRLISPP